MKPSLRRCLVRLSLLMALTFAAAASPAQASPDSAQPAQTQAQGHGEAQQESEGIGPNGGIGVILEQSTERAAHQAEVWGHKFGIGHDTSYLLSILINFAVLVLFFYALLKSSLASAEHYLRSAMFFSPLLFSIQAQRKGLSVLQRATSSP